jgi:hypothetical protein
MFIDLRTDNDATNGNHLISTSNDADYDQLLGQAEHGSIPLQSSILLNPWFLKEVTARLQRNEDEASSDDESFVYFIRNWPKQDYCSQYNWKIIKTKNIKNEQ